MQNPNKQADLIEFFSLVSENISLVHHWLRQPHVACWYGDGVEPTLDAVKRKLVPRIQGQEQVHCYLIQFNRVNIGYIQWYDARQFSREGYHLSDIKFLADYLRLAAIDFYIGDKEYIGKGIGSHAIAKFVERIIPAEFDVCYADPDSDNSASIHALQKAGFTMLQRITTLDDKKILAMVCLRRAKI